MKNLFGRWFPKESPMRQTFHTLSFPGFRTYLSGQAISLLGTAIQVVAFKWLLYSMTKDPASLGLVGLATFVPQFLLSFFGGQVADRFDRRKVLMVTMVLAAVQSCLVAGLFVFGTLEPWHLFAFSALTGARNAFELPTRRALSATLVERESLASAYSLSSSIIIASQTVGYALAGFFMEYLSATGCFLLDAATFVAAYMTLRAMRSVKIYTVTPGTKASASLESAGDLAGQANGLSGPNPTLRAVAKFCYTSVSTRTVFMTAAVAHLLAVQYFLLLPVIASDVMKGSAATLGYLSAFSSIGAALGALLLAGAKREEMRLTIRMATSAVFFAIAMFLFSFASSLAYALPIIVFMGLFINTVLNGNQALLQLGIPDELRGRISSLMLMTMSGFETIGNLIAGWSARHIGAPWTLTAISVVLFGLALWYRRSLVRKLAAQQALAREQGAGQSATALNGAPKGSADGAAKDASQDGSEH